MSDEFSHQVAMLFYLCSLHLMSQIFAYDVQDFLLSLLILLIMHIFVLKFSIFIPSHRVFL